MTQKIHELSLKVWHFKWAKINKLFLNEPNNELL